MLFHKFYTFSKGSGIHIDLVRAPEQLDAVLAILPEKRIISLGLVDGRNVWLSTLQQCHAIAQKVVQKVGCPSRVLVSTSCSLLHVPFSTKLEKPNEIPKTVVTGISGAKILPWLAFGKTIFNVF